MSFYSLGFALEEVLKCSIVKYILKWKDKAVYWDNTDVCKLIPTCSTDCPWDLLIIIAKTSLTSVTNFIQTYLYQFFNNSLNSTQKLLRRPFDQYQIHLKAISVSQAIKQSVGNCYNTIY